MFADFSAQNQNTNAYGEAIKWKAEDEERFSFGVTQQDIDEYVDNAYENKNNKDYLPYSSVSQKLINDVAYEIDISGYSHALRDNDIRHIRNSHGEQTNEKYPVTKDDLSKIPYIINNYDKVFVKTNASGKPGIVYVKVGENNVIYYVEAVTQEYHNEKLLVNKQMVKAGIDYIPNLFGLEKAINKKESSSQYLADLQGIREAYVQDVKENYSKNSIYDSAEKINPSDKNSSDRLSLPDENTDLDNKGSDSYNYTKEQYERFGWARYAEVITINELDDLYSKISGRKTLRTFKQSSKGEAIIEINDSPHTTLGTNNVFAFLKGTKNNFVISRVVRFDAETEVEMDIIKEVLYERRTFSDTHLEFLKQKGFATEYTRESAKSFSEYQELQKGRTTSRRANTDNRGSTEHGAGYTLEARKNRESGQTSTKEIERLSLPDEEVNSPTLENVAKEREQYKPGPKDKFFTAWDNFQIEASLKPTGQRRINVKNGKHKLAV